MRKLNRAGAGAVVALSALALVAPGSANAAVAGDKPHHKPVVHPAAPVAPPMGRIIVCNHSGYMFDVYADGPSIREDDLAGSFDECTDWAKVMPGKYDIGFGLRTPTNQPLLIQARFKREGHVYYKTFNNQGVISSSVSPNGQTKVDLFIPQG